MAAINYLNFDLTLESLPGSVNHYRARVLTSPAGEASTEFTLPFSALELENFLLRVGRPRRGVRRIDSPEMVAARNFGRTLFESVFKEDVRDCLHRSLDNADKQQGQGVRLRLRLTEAPELIDLPWEYLYDSTLQRFLSHSRDTPIVRYLDLPQRIAPLAVQPPLKVLVMIASPRDYARLDVDAEWHKVYDALADLEERGLVTLTRLPRPTLGELQRHLRRDEYHIFHFIGHGGFDAQIESGVLLLEDENGLSRLVGGRAFGTLLHDHPSLRLVLLNACEGARTTRNDPFSGVAQHLVQQGMPAVIAMQFEITDAAAITLAQEFYAALADSYPVDAALAEARKALFTQGNDIEWGTPALYMRASDGRIFELQQFDVKPQQQEPSIKRPERSQLESTATIPVVSLASEPDKITGPSNQPVHHSGESSHETIKSRRKLNGFFWLVVATVILAILALTTISVTPILQWVATIVNIPEATIAYLPEATIMPTPDLSKVLPKLKTNALELWAADLQNKFNPTGHLSDNLYSIHKRNIPVGVVCNVAAVDGGYWPMQYEEWRLACSMDNFRSAMPLTVNGVAARGLISGSYYTVDSVFTVYGTGIWPDSFYQEDDSANPESQAPKLKANALELWAGLVQSKFNASGKLSDNVLVMRRYDLPQGVACDVAAVDGSYWPKQYEEWRLACSVDDFLTSVPITVNGTAARGLTGGSYYGVDNPFTVYGTGIWPDGSFESAVSSEQSSSLTQDAPTEPAVSLEQSSSLKQGAPTLRLKSRALEMWAGLVQNKFNASGKLSDNVQVMGKRDIPQGVACDVAAVDNGYSPKQYEEWRLACSVDNFRSSVPITVNGTAARGLTGGAYYGVDNPFTVYGTGIWPDGSYEPIKMPTPASTQTITTTPTIPITSTRTLTPTTRISVTLTVTGTKPDSSRNESPISATSIPTPTPSG